MKRYYAKSFEEDFILKTVKNKKKVPFQSVQDILKKNIIKPNTLSFGRKRRLACTFINKNYFKTYRPQGLIFETNEKPSHVYPFDLVMLTDVKNLIVRYYRIKEKLHEYYGHKLLSGFEKFMFNLPEEMIEQINSPRVAWKMVNDFRKRAGYPMLPKSKYKLVEYNEIMFNKPIKIKPLALFGYNKLSKEIAKEYGISHYINVKEFYSKLSRS